MKFRKLLLLLGTTLLLAGCNGEALPATTATPTPAVVNSTTPLPTEALVPTNTPTPTSSPTPAILYLKDANIEGLTVNKITSDSQEIQLIASLDWELKKNDLYYTPPQLLKCENGYVYAGFSHYNQEPDGEFFKETNRELIVSKFSFDNGNLFYEPVFNFKSGIYSYITNFTDDFFWIADTILIGENYERYYTSLDYSGKQIATGQHYLDTTFSLAGYEPNLLYCEDQDGHEVIVQNISDKSSCSLRLNDNLSIKSLFQLYMVDGTLYYSGEFLGSDLVLYSALINSETGDPLYCYPSDSQSYVNYTNGIAVKNNWENGETIFVYKNKEYKFSIADDFLSYSFIDDHTIMFDLHDRIYETLTYTDSETGESWDYECLTKDTICLKIFDFEQEKVLASAYFEPKLYSTVDSITKITDDTLIFSCGMESGCEDYYYWNYSNHTDLDSDKLAVNVSAFSSFENALPNGEFTRDKLVSLNNDDTYNVVLEKVKKIEDKYGISIKYANEANCLMGNYVISGATDIKKLLSTLDIIDANLALYPEGFFISFKTDRYPDGLNLYLADKIIGTNDYSLSTAGGLTNDVPGSIDIVMDIYDYVPSTIHHEMSHAIDDLLSANGYYYSYDEWNDLNVNYTGANNDFYTYTYVNYNIDQTNEKYILYYASKNNNVIFVDHYSTTFPTEDRARIFEKYMTNALDFNAYPGLKLKKNAILNKISKCLGYNL